MDSNSNNIDNNSEGKILKISVWGTLFFAIFGLAWGWFIKSEMIMFDGLYSFVSVILSLASLVVCNIIRVKDNKDFPFGKYILEPLVIGINSLVIIIMCIFSLTDAVKSFILGGNAVDTGSAIIYAIISTVGSSVFYFKIKNQGIKINSDLIKTEAVQWLMDGILSAAVFVAFIIVAILSKTSLVSITRYIDPLMVIITSILFLKEPIKILMNSFKEVIGAKIPEEISIEVEKQAQVIRKEYNFGQAVTRVLKIGRSVKIEVNFIIDEKLVSIEEMDNIKMKLYEDIDSENYFKDMNVLFTPRINFAIA